MLKASVTSNLPLNVRFYHVTPDSAKRQYCHAIRSGATNFSTSKTLLNMSYLAAPTHMVRLRYLVTPPTARPKELSSIKYFIERLILKYLFKKEDTGPKQAFVLGLKFKTKWFFYF
jgi:hypothetical protein